MFSFSVLLHLATVYLWYQSFISCPHFWLLIDPSTTLVWWQKNRPKKRKKCTMITRIGFQAAVNGNFEWMFWGLCPLVNNNLCTATRLSDAQGPLSSPTWKSPVFLLNEHTTIARSTFIFAISSWIDIHICIVHSVQCQEYRIQNFQFRKRRFTCVWLDWILSFHSSERGKFSFPVHGNNTRTRPRKTKCQKHKTSTAVVIDGNQEIGKSALPASFASLVEASGWWSNKTSRCRLTFEYFLSPQAQFSAQLHSIV